MSELDQMYQEVILDHSKRRIGEGEFGLALVEAVAHLNHLHRAGVIRPVEERNGAVLWGA